jgi:hypothetical protein
MIRPRRAAGVAGANGHRAPSLRPAHNRPAPWFKRCEGPCYDRGMDPTRARLFGLLSLALLVSCGTVPKTPLEYKQMAKDHPSARIEKVRVAQPPEIVFDRIRARSDRCLNYSLRKAGMGGAFSFFTQSEKTGAKTGETAMWINRYIFLVVDTEPAGKSSTLVTLYGGQSDAFRRYFDSFSAWAKGTDDSCPER